MKSRVVHQPWTVSSSLTRPEKSFRPEGSQMARFNEILVGRFNRALQKLFSMKGGPPAAQLASEITTNVQFNQMGNDFRYLEGWDIFGNQIFLAASVGNTAGYRLRNPGGSNVIAV